MRERIQSQVCISRGESEKVYVSKEALRPFSLSTLDLLATGLLVTCAFAFDTNIILFSMAYFFYLFIFLKGGGQILRQSTSNDFLPNIFIIGQYCNKSVISRLNNLGHSIILYMFILYHNVLTSCYNRNGILRQTLKKYQFITILTHVRNFWRESH